MLSKEIVKIINDQINVEFNSAYLYLNMANFFEENGLSGFSHWFILQSKEEQMHAMKFIDYLHDNCSNVIFYDLILSQNDFTDFLQPLILAFDHEKLVTSKICKIYTVAESEGDIRTKSFLKWFIDEQLEEEKNARTLIEKMSMFSDVLGHELKEMRFANGLYQLDKECMKRS